MRERPPHFTAVISLMLVDFKVPLLVYTEWIKSRMYMNDLLIESKPNRALRSTHSGQIVEPRVQSKHGEAEMEADLKSAPTMKVLKSRSTPFFFLSSFKAL